MLCWPLVGGSLSVFVGGLIADYVVRKFGPVARVFVIMVSLVSIYIHLVHFVKNNTRSENSVCILIGLPKYTLNSIC